MNRSLESASLGALVALGCCTAIGLAQPDPAGPAAAAAKQPSALPNCPVMGDEPVNLAVSVATKEGPVFFCCADCIPKYQSDPTKYASKVAAQRQALADRPKVQVTCPVSGDAVDSKFFVETGGRKILFCSEKCAITYRSNPGQYASALANSFTFQTKCPVMGKEIDPKASIPTAGGAKVYFCCKGCDKKLLGDPAKYLPSLASQGIAIDPKDLAQAKPKEHANHDHGSHDHDH